MAVFGTKGTNHVSEPTDLLGGADTNPNDLFRVELADNGTAQLSWVTRPVSGTDNVAYYFGPHLPADGRYVAFLSSNPGPLLGTGAALSVWEHGYAVGQVDPVIVDDGYAGWAAGLPAANRGPLDLPFGDGINNLRKFVHGLAAASSDGTGLPSAEVLPGSAVGLAGDDRPYLVVTVRTRRPLPAGYGVAVRSGASLSALATAPASVPASGPPVPDGPVDLHRYVYPVPVGSEAVDGYLELEVFGP